MKDFSKTHLTFLVLFLILGLGGGYFWYWSISNLATQTAARSSVQGKLATVEKKALPPTSAMLSKLEELDKEFTQLSIKSIDEVKQNVDQFDLLAPKQEQGKLPVGLPPDAWKNQMNQRRIELDKLAAKTKVGVPPKFYYGFQSFVIQNPEEKYTGQLGIQLLGLTEISKILINSRVNQYVSAKRVWVPEASKQGGASPNANDDGLSASILTGPQNLYQVYPFEVEIRTTTVALRDVINGLNQSKYFFVIRFLAVENEKLNVKSKSAIQTEVAAEATRKNFLVVPVAGNEMIRARIRIDMLVWSKQIFGAEKAPEGKGASK